MNAINRILLALAIIAALSVAVFAQAGDEDYEVYDDYDYDVDADYDDAEADMAADLSSSGMVDVSTDAADVKIGPQGQVSVKSPRGNVDVNGSAVSVQTDRTMVKVNPQGHVLVKGDSDAIRAMIEGDADLDSDEIGALDDAAEFVSIKPGRIVAGNVTVELTNKTLHVSANGVTVDIVLAGGRVHINDGGVEVDAEEGVEVDDQKIKVRGIEIKLPSQAINADLREKSTKVDLVADGDTPVYSVETEEDEHFLGLFPVKVKVQHKVHASTGEDLGKHRPWWAFMSF